ncbi:MAG: YggS family pyridoxal phosphate-dependent enzyme [Nitrospirae bacterium]|nr:YggS family pyridoxal phosphate-dependent enzyme [Nitrospirota bacterium]
MELKEALFLVRKRIAEAARRAGRDQKGIRLVAVTKNVEIQRIIQAINSGVNILGESRVQEAQKKVTSNELRVTSGRIEWHLIGHLQTNKANIAVQLFDLIHSIDSIHLAQELNKHARRIGKIQPILVQVKLSEEATKYGVSEEGLMEIIETVSNMENLKLEGLMTIPPFFEESEKARPYFRRLRELKEELNNRGFALNELSMGMSGDFEVAIEEGATMVRVGTAIFGERTQKNKTPDH